MTAQGTNSSTLGSVSIGISAIGYVITYSIAILLILAHLVHIARRLNAFRLIKESQAQISEDLLVQTGYRFSRSGQSIRWGLILFVCWLQTAIILSIVGHYNGVWVFDPSIPRGAVDWDSYTRLFLMAWSASILLAITCRVFREELRTFYMLPAPLGAAVYIHMSQTLIDSSDARGEMAVKHHEIVPVKASDVRYVEFLLKRYIWTETAKMFLHGSVFDKNGPTGNEANVLKRVGGLSVGASIKRQREVGRNEIVLSVPSLFRMTVNELSSFFYIYQISSCWLPFFWDYVTVGLMTLVLVLTSAMVKIRMEHKQKNMLKTMATMHGNVWVKREGEWTKLSSEELVPGDLICLCANDAGSSNEILADCLVISGHAIVDEAALSGETMPVQKFSTPLTDDRRNPEEVEHKKYFLFAGTNLLQSGGSRDPCPTGISDGTLAIVITSGADTARGSLIRGLIFGASLKSKLFIELRYSLGILVVIAALDFLSLNARFEMSLSSMLTAMYSIIGLINPLMAVSLVAGEMQSAKRLKDHMDHRVYTRDLHRLTIAGKVDLALLDKTGTITKSGLDFYGIVPSQSLQFTDCNSFNAEIPADLSSALALAHTVSVCNKQTIGHQVELRMVETAQRLGWKFDADLRGPTAPSGKKWIAEKLFPFSHETMTMSVIAYSEGIRSVICKGSFEALRSRCTGITAEMNAKATQYAKDGCYVIAVGTKDIKSDLSSHEILREEVEKDLKFSGFILFRNELKPDSKEAIAELESAGIAVRMMTGDSVYTGTAVAKSVGIVPSGTKAVIGTVNPDTKWVQWKMADSDETITDDVIAKDISSFTLCITGEVFALLSSQGTLNLEATRVYGRVSPNQKAEIVRLYTAAGKVVTMCGDGANDSSGLRAAHAGLALSGRTEASISAPFSTDSDSLMTLNLLIREARAALCTSLASYQTLVVVGILYCISKSILLFQAVAYQAGLAYLYLDLITTPLMLYALVHARPAKRLADKPPEGSLFGSKLVLSCMWSVFVCIMFLLLADLVMVNQDWFVPFQAGAGVGLEEWQKRGNNFEAALIFIWSAWVYIDIPLTYSTGGIHRAPMYTNFRLVLATMALLSVTLAVMFVHSGEFGCYFKVACSASDSAAAIDAFVNNFLFPYEKVGGTWWNSQIDSTEYPLSFKLGLFFILLSMSVVHHAGYMFINSKLGNRITAWKIPKMRDRETKLSSERTTSTDLDVKVESMTAPLK